MASLGAHLKTQRKQIARMAFYGIQAFAVAMIGAWLFAPGGSWLAKTIVCAVFGFLVFVVGLNLVMSVSKSGNERSDRD